MPLPKTIALIGALDTKGEDFAFVKNQIEAHGLRALVIDTGVIGEPAFAPTIDASALAEAGGSSLEQLRAQADRGHAIEIMARGAAAVVADLHQEGRIDGILSMGGSAGTTIGTAAMRALPLGLPKLMVSTLASGDVSPYVGIADIVMMPAVVDVAGVNAISAGVYTRAAAAMAGMVAAPTPTIAEKPLIAVSMFGNTTELVNKCRARLQAAGYETLVFHATGTGGRLMESLIRSGHIHGVLDVTTTEWADELVGGVLSAGPQRLDAAAESGIPQVIAPGCLDMVNFGARESVPDKFRTRRFYVWNPSVTLMRTTPDENRSLGRILAEKANAATAPVAFCLPLRGLSVLDSPGGEFWWPEADQALFAAIREFAHSHIAIDEVDSNINDDAFADAVVQRLLAFLHAAV